MSTYCVTFRSSSPQPEGATQLAEEKPALPLPPGPPLLPLPPSPSQPAECFSSPPGCFGFSRNRLARRRFPLGRVSPGRGQKPGAARAEPRARPRPSPQQGDQAVPSCSLRMLVSPPGKRGPAWSQAPTCGQGADASWRGFPRPCQGSERSVIKH